jgi:hypothetical protein
MIIDVKDNVSKNFTQIQTTMRGVLNMSGTVPVVLGFCGSEFSSETGRPLEAIQGGQFLVESQFSS